MDRVTDSECPAGAMHQGAAEIRAAQWAQLATDKVWDLVVIGGGATGLGVALDAAARGYSVALLEQWDFAKGTSSRATKLLHGGVRYLAQGNIKLVREALHERAVVLRNAPHLAERLAFVIPVYSRWRLWQYGIGLKVYSWLAGSRSLGKTEWLSAAETVAALPTVRQDGLVGGVRYWDGQFDDARLALALATTAVEQGAVVMNYCPVEQLLHTDGLVSGVVCRDAESGERRTLRAACVVNATGVWVDALCQQDSPVNATTASAVKPGQTSPAEARVQPSRGAHVVLDRTFLPSDAALMVPATSDGRVLFAIPWQGHLLAGTTDVPTDLASADPQPTADETDFILRELGRYLTRPPERADIRSQWAGLRPLVRPDTAGVATKGISREHEIWVRSSGLVSVTGGKWTTYRVIADDTLRVCQDHALLGPARPCQTAHLSLQKLVPALDSWPGADVLVAPGLTEAMVRYAVRCEYARTVDDVLARRVRLLFLDAAAAARSAPRVAELLQEEGCPAPAFADFLALAAQYGGSLQTQP